VAAEAFDGSARIRWSAVPDASGYVLYMAEKESELPDRVNANPYTTCEASVDGLLDGRTYRFSVSAVDQEGAEGPRASAALVTLSLGMKAPVLPPPLARGVSKRGITERPVYVPLINAGIEPYVDTDLDTSQIGNQFCSRDSERWSCTGFGAAVGAGTEETYSLHAFLGGSGGSGTVSNHVLAATTLPRETRSAVFTAVFADLDAGYTTILTNAARFSICAAYSFMRRSADVADDPSPGDARSVVEMTHALGIATRFTAVVFGPLGLRMRTSLQYVGLGSHDDTVVSAATTSLMHLSGASGYRLGMITDAVFRLTEPVTVEAGFSADYHMVSFTRTDTVFIPGVGDRQRTTSLTRCGLTTFLRLGFRYQF